MAAMSTHEFTDLTNRVLGIDFVTAAKIDRQHEKAMAGFHARTAARTAAAAAAPAPALPTCAAFAGIGQRCTTCRVHRNIHN